MSAELFKKLKRFRQSNKISIAELCEQIGAHYTTYHRWKSSGKITGPYKKIIEDFLEKNISSKASFKIKDPLHLPPPKSSDIAVIGMACYYPGACNIPQLWENILARRVQFRRMLDQRLPMGEYYDADPKSPEKMYLTKAAFLEDFKFDWGKLRIPKKTVESTDIAHWLALDIALKTFEDAGFKLNEIPLQNTGVIVGNTLTGEQTRSQTLRLRWPFVQKALNATLGHLGKGIEERSQIASEMEKIYKSAFYPVTEDSLAGGLANTIAGRICNYLNLKGGGYIVDGACSSSLLAVATAADALKMGNMDMVLAGGVDISLDPFELVGFSKAGALAKDQMRVYDKEAKGFLPGEGCGFVLLKRLKDALRDKNYVYAVIKGWGISSDGKGGIMEPSSSGQSFAIGRAYKDLDYKIADVNFVEGHGTGTTKGDRVELEGIATAVEKTVNLKNKNVRSCGVTSFKSIVGHTKAAAGIGGLIKAILGVNQRILPPTASCSDPNEVFQDKAKNLYPIIQGGFIGNKKIARAGISSAGFGGINCHITIESKDKPKLAFKPKINERALFVSQQQTEVFVFTSRTIIHLKKIIEKFKADLRNISIAEMADLAALLNKKVKNRLPIKASIITDTPEHLYEALVLLEQEISTNQIEERQIYRVKAIDVNTRIILSNNIKKNRVGFLYPGQGSQRLNMTRTIVERFDWAQDFLKLSKLPISDYVYKPVDKFFSKEEQQWFEKHLSDTRITQPAVVLSSLIWTEFLSKLGVEPMCVAGHSLGELMAFYKGGAFSKEALVRFAEFRGELMGAGGRSSGGMVSLFCSKERAEEMIGKVSGNLVIANINSPSQIIASGASEDILKVMELAKKEEISAIRLNVSNAFHSSFMKRASEKIRSSKTLAGTYKSGSIGVYSSMGGIAIDGNVDLKEYFSEQMISPVNFVGLIEAISKDCDVFIEVGPGRVLTDLVKAIKKDIVCLPIESTSGNDRDLNILLAELFVRNIPINWDELYKNRLIRTFVPASRKKFIENQCEHPLKIGNQVIKNDDLPVIAHSQEPADQKDEIIPGGLPEVRGSDQVAELLIKLTQQITGFDLASISLNLRLLDDLNLDSIKAAELIGQAARSLGLAGQIDPSQLSNNTLGQISERLSELVAVSKAGPTKESVADILKRYQDKSWVRNFTTNFRPEEITTKNVNQLKALKNVVIISDKNEVHLIKSLEDEFKNTKAKTHKFNFGDDTTKLEKLKSIDCLITILPKSIRHPSQSINKDILKSIIKRLHQIIELAHSKLLNKDSFVVFAQFEKCATAIASTLYLERPELKLRIIDFVEGTDEVKMAEKILDELQTYEPFNVVGYDLKLLRHVVYYENSYPVDYKKRNIRWSNKDIILVTGGAKGITAQCALEFARVTQAQMVLVGRSPLPENMQDDSSEIVGTFRQFEREHLKCFYYQCDVANEKDIVRTIGQIEKDLGRVTGVIHGAGLNSLKRLKQASVEESFKEALPKVMGAVNICNALKNHPPKLFVGITSIIGLTGMEGSGWYGLSNELLNLYLQTAFFSQAEVVTIAYSVWDEVGMGAKLGSVSRLAEKGIGAIPVDEGIERFKQLVEGDPGVQQVIVAARIAGIATWKSPEAKENNFRFLEKIEYLLPGVELVAHASLNIEDDPYLLDHNWKGSLLFPFVFGFEAMAQAVAYVLGVEKFDHIKARDINLQRPISVLQNVGTTVEIHAQVMEPEKSDGKLEVKVAIYSQESAYKEPHFSAIFEINNQAVIPAKIDPKIQLKARNVIELDIPTDIYGPILFQGKMFQCIDKIHELYYDEKTNKGECVFTSVYNKSTEEFLRKNKKFNKRFLIGDPFFIDSVLQSMQVIIPQDISLPRDIENIDLNFVQEKEKVDHVSLSNIKRIGKDFYRGDAKIVTRDGFNLKIENCRLKVLDTILSNPSANDLVNPSKRDEKIIKNKLLELSNELGFVPPVVKCLYDKQLENTSKEKRHKIELPLIKEAVEELFKRENKPIKKIKIKWLQSGKPVIEGNNFKDIGISISHSGSFLMVIVGYGEQGCDVEVLKVRKIEEWRDILGVQNFKIYQSIDKESIDKDFVCTSIWGLMETMLKIESGIRYKFLIDAITVNHIVFDLDEEISKKVVSFRLKLTQETLRVFSFLINKINKEINQNKSKNLLKEAGYNEDAFKLKLEYSGPQDQLVFIKSYPITFRTNKLLSRRVYFTSYFDWIGEIREQSANPIMEYLSGKFQSGNWGIATYSTKLEILGELNASDILETHFWSEKVDSKIKGTYDLCIDWKKITPNQVKERVAFSRQRIIWVKVVSHGVAQVEELPDFIEIFMDTMKPRIKIKKSLEVLPQKYSNLEKGNQIISFKDRIKDKLLLIEKVVNTTLENSNLVGNIYFSNYAKWIGMISDLYFYSLMPELYRGSGEKGEFACVGCEINHLNEAMPFDNILVKMYIDSVYKNALDFVFEFYLVREDKVIKKLAYAKYEIILVTRTVKEIIQSIELPKKIIDQFVNLKNI